MVEVPSQDFQDSLPSYTSQIPLVQGSIHIPIDSFQLIDNLLQFKVNCTVNSSLICKFFVEEDGLGFVQHKNYKIPNQTFEISKGFSNLITIPLNLQDFSYDLIDCLPIVIEVYNKDIIEITILQINGKNPKVLQQRIIKDKVMYEIKEIFNPPEENQEEREAFCVICMSFERNIVTEPCCHICLCEKCANLMRTQVDRKCPMCRKGKIYLEVGSFIKINL